MADSQVDRGAEAREGRDDFYVGYEPHAAASISSHARLWVVGIVLAGLGVAVGLGIVQEAFPVAFFDFGLPRTYEGVVTLEPHPTLEVERPGRASGGGPPGGTTSGWLLVGFGKHGAHAELEGLDGRRVRLEGTPIYRDDQTMLEIVPGTVEAVAGGGGGEAVARTSPGRAISLGERVLEGEIVDSKCYLGVMKPASWKPHRACASLCIRGGIPPLFVLRDAEGVPVEHLLLLDGRGRAPGDEILEFVAEPVRVRGEVSRVGERWILKADPESFERLP
ncbi:MAG: hypothetical protein MI919_25795 [Holophagales bacterium]|nr:hypothetical protein [Holophagales bacterium]